MTDSSKRKMEFVIERTELPQLLAKLGEDVRSGAIVVGGNSMELGEFRSLEIKIKALDQEMIRVKLKIKYPKYDSIEGLRVRVTDEEEGEWPMPGASGRPKYDDLKDRMKATFKAIARSLEAGKMPEDSLARLFLNDCRLMTTYEGQGDEYYPVFLDKVELWAAALESNDIEALTQAHQELDRQKKACHDRYK